MRRRRVSKEDRTFSFCSGIFEADSSTPGLTLAWELPMWWLHLDLVVVSTIPSAGLDSCGMELEGEGMSTGFLALVGTEAPVRWPLNRHLGEGNNRASQVGKRSSHRGSVDRASATSFLDPPLRPARRSQFHPFRPARRDGNTSYFSRLGGRLAGEPKSLCDSDLGELAVVDRFDGRDSVG